MLMSHIALHSRSYLLHPLLRNVKAPLDNFARCAGIVLEIPPMGQMGYELEIEGLWKKLCGCHQTVCMIVQPDFHRRHARVCWAHRWRKLPTAQKYSFKQCCSCQFGKTDAHIKYYVCSTSDVEVPPCSAIPSVSLPRENLWEGLELLVRGFVHGCIPRARQLLSEGEVDYPLGSTTTGGHPSG